MKVLNLEYYLAEQAIKDYFAQNDESKQFEDEILKYSRDKYPPIYSSRVAYRIQRRHINFIIVSSVLADLPQFQREIIVRKFQKHEMSQKIALDLNISISRLSTIERSVEKNINHMLKYTLTIQDVYSHIKVANMIHILDLRLSFLDEHPEILPIVNKDWISSLHICREKYRRLYSAMQEVFIKEDSSLHYYIIATRLRDPSLSSKDLSALCHVTQNGVNRHLRTYESDMSKYLVA